MRRRIVLTRCLIAWSALCLAMEAGAALRVATDFPGGSGDVTSLHPGSRIVRMQPTAHPDRGWPCWWYVRLEGAPPGAPVTLEVRGMNFALPERAAVSHDHKLWTQSAPGEAVPGGRVYRIVPNGGTTWVAWGPPYQAADALSLVRRLASEDPSVDAFELCRTREGRPVPALRFRPTSQEPSSGHRIIWVQARQHAWECGSSWVAQGLAEWLVTPDAQDLRTRTEIIVVPVVDIDNVERGAGGKDQKPHDHNRDWSDNPHWNAVRATQSFLTQRDARGLLSVFIDLHNPGPGDREPFFFMAPESLLSPPSRSAHARFFEAARRQLSEGSLPYRGTVRTTGPEYHPRWEQISSVWVARSMTRPVVAVCLETSWNTPASQVEGYEEVGARLGKALALFETGGGKYE